MYIIYICVCIHVHQRETTRRNTCGSERMNQPTPFPPSLSSILFCLSIFSLPSFWFSHSFACPRSPSTLFLLLSLITKPPRACIKQACVCVCERRDPPTPSPARSFSLARATLLLGSYTHTYKCI
jgi:hypothetical protein